MLAIQVTLWARTLWFKLEEITGTIIENKTLDELERIRNHFIDETKQWREKEIQKCKGLEYPGTLEVGTVVHRKNTPIEWTLKLESNWTGPFWIIKNVGKRFHWIQGVSGNTMKVNRKDIDHLPQYEIEGLIFEEEAVSPAGVCVIYQ